MFFSIDDFESFWQKLFAIVEQHFDGSSSCHDFDHTIRVLNNAQMLAKKLPNANIHIVKCAALLHDIARANEDSTQGKCCHAQLGAEMVKDILNEFNLPEEFINKVSNAVRTHRYRANILPDTLEGKIVFDADKLDSLGAIGVGRAFLFAGHHNAKLHNTTAVALAAEEYSLEDTAYREYLVKLRHLPNVMQTEPGKKIAMERIDFMTNFFNQLNMESGQNEA